MGAKDEVGALRFAEKTISMSQYFDRNIEKWDAGEYDKVEDTPGGNMSELMRVILAAMKAAVTESLSYKCGIPLTSSGAAAWAGDRVGARSNMLRLVCETEVK